MSSQLVSADRETATPDLPSGGPTAGAPWLFVVAPGDARLVAALEAIFRDDPRVRVIEDRQLDHALLPPLKAFVPFESPTG